MTEEDCYLAFSLTTGIGPKRFLELRKVFGLAKKAWQGTETEFQKAGIGRKTFVVFSKARKNLDLVSYKQQLKKSGVSFIPQNNSLYPQDLLQLENPPIGLFFKGDNLLLNKAPKISIVGTRKITSYGKAVTEKLAADLVDRGFVTVSGLALGVDAEAHLATIENNGKTIAVLGCGVDCCFPKENQKLYDRILNSGGLIVSEYPLGAEPSKGSFPARNRIVAALSEGILITEAAEGSGSLITAEIGRKLDKKIYAIPGPITSRMSVGTSGLLKTGAKLVTSVDDILTDLGSDGSVKQKRKITDLQVSSNEVKVLLLLEKEELHVEEMAKKLKIPVSELLILASGLEMKGYVSSQNGLFCLSPHLLSL